MGIDTNLLQQPAVLKGADSLMLADSDKGTAQLPLADLAKFLAEQDNAVKAALEKKAAKSAQETVEATSAPSRTVEVAAANLPDYIAGLPRLLTQNLTINVTGSGEIGYVDIRGFYGPGRLAVRGNENAAFAEGVNIIDCCVHIGLAGLNVTGRRNNSSSNAHIVVNYSPIVSLSSLTIDGDPNNRAYGIGSHTGSRIYVSESSVKNCSAALYASLNGQIIAVNCTGSGNTRGSGVYWGGVIMLCGSTPKLMGGESNTNGVNGAVFMGDILTT